jgi:osmotically-inducible protein OsmY
METAECQERQRELDLAVEAAIRRRLEEHGACAFYFNEVTCECEKGVLRVRGRVPTDRLKRVLWSLLENLDGITEIDDHLDVISSSGLSIVHPG